MGGCKCGVYQSVLGQKITVDLLQEHFYGTLCFAGVKLHDGKSNGLTFLDPSNKIVIIFSISEVILLLGLLNVD